MLSPPPLPPRARPGTGAPAEGEDSETREAEEEDAEGRRGVPGLGLGLVFAVKLRLRGSCEELLLDEREGAGVRRGSA